MTAPATTVLLGGENAEPARALLAARGLRVVTAADRVTVGVALFSPEWAEGWRRAVEEVYALTATTLPLLRPAARIVVVGPPNVAAPGPGYPESVKARLALARWRSELEGVDAEVVWGSLPDAVTQIQSAGLVGARQ